jgi:hypothetical protein
MANQSQLLLQKQLRGFKELIKTSLKIPLMASVLGYLTIQTYIHGN